MEGRRANSSFPPSLLLSLSLSLFLSIFLPSCGKIGDPLPPIPRAPLVINELNVAQQGTQLVLSFPLVRSPRSPRLQRIDIYRLIESTIDPLGISPENFSTRATVIASIPGDQFKADRSTATYSDSLDLKNTSRNSRYRYAIRLVTTGGAVADLSNYATIVPLFELSLPPADLKATQRETEIEITWAAAASNENGSKPANVAAYNIYRRPDDADAKTPPTKLNAEPLKETRYIDRNFQFGTKYDYFVRALSPLPDNTSLSTAIESNGSAELVYTPKDTFPPAAPSPVQIASIGGIVSLFWPLNSEPDIAGYNVYRAEDENASPDKWVKLNAQLHKTASFRDERVQVGKTYFYRITAIDNYGNESARSTIVSETVNP